MYTPHHIEPLNFGIAIDNLAQIQRSSFNKSVLLFHAVARMETSISIMSESHLILGTSIGILMNCYLSE